VSSRSSSRASPTRGSCWSPEAREAARHDPAGFVAGLGGPAVIDEIHHARIEGGELNMIDELLAGRPPQVTGASVGPDA
jgi:hypothetical protein